MKDITSKDLKESLILLSAKTLGDDEGGSKDVWYHGQHLWACLWPILNNDSFHSQDEGGSMASHIGYLKNIVPLKYKLFIRKTTSLPQKFAFQWNLKKSSKRLNVLTAPISIQDNRFLRMIVMEATHA